MPRPRPPPAAPASPDDIVCVHPGGPRVIGPAAVRASFEAMFGNGSIDAHPERVRRLQGAACAVHSVLEHVRVGTAKGPRSAWVLATNVYVQTARGWRLVAHHASPGSEREIQELLEAGSTIH